MLELFLKGGIVMPFILLCSVVAVIIIIERFIYFKRLLGAPIAGRCVLPWKEINLNFNIATPFVSG